MSQVAAKVISHEYSMDVGLLIRPTNLEKDIGLAEMFIAVIDPRWACKLFLLVVSLFTACDTVVVLE